MLAAEISQGSASPHKSWHMNINEKPYNILIENFKKSLAKSEMLCYSV